MISNLLDWVRNMSSKPITITIINLKGGTGKTTLAALLSYGLAKMGRKVLVIDLDPESHLSSLFLPITEIENVSGGSLDFAIVGAGYRVRTVYNDGRGKIDILPSGLNYIVRVFEGSIPAWDSHAIAVRIERELRGRYDYVICDSPPEIMPPTMWAVFASDYIVIPTNLEELSLTGLKILVRYILPPVLERSRKGFRILGVVLVNITRHWHKQTISSIESSITNYILNTVPQLATRIYHKLFFDTIIYRHAALRDLMYEPGRWSIPLFSVVEKYVGIRSEVESLSREVENRIMNFRPMVSS